MTNLNVLALLRTNVKHVRVMELHHEYVDGVLVNSRMWDIHDVKYINQDSYAVLVDPTKIVRLEDTCPEDEKELLSHLSDICVSWTSFKEFMEDSLEVEFTEIGLEANPLFI